MTTASATESVSVAVWSSEGGQDDIKWYTLKKNAETGEWTGTINGKYLQHTGLCHAYVYAKGNVFIGSTTFDFKEEDKAKNTVSITGSGVSRTAKASLVTKASGVKVAVWSAEGGQDDIKWYNLSDKGSNEWSGKIDLGYLLHSGTAHAHFYTSGNTFLGSTNFTVSADQAASKLITVTDSGLTKKVTVNVAGRSGVKIAVWSATGSQDDITWYNLKQTNSNTWTINMPLYNLKHSGDVYIHAYDGGNVYLGAKTISVSASQISSSASIKGSGSNIDFVQWAINIANNDAIGYGHTYPKTISCAGLVGLALTYCGYGDFIKNDPLGWGYIDLGTEYEAELVNVCGAQVLNGPWYGARAGELQPGDILYYYNSIYSNHVGIYIGNGMTVEARGPAGASDADSSGAEVAVYHWAGGADLTYQRVYRLPNLHYTS